MNFLSHSTGRPITGLHTPGPSPCSAAPPFSDGGQRRRRRRPLHGFFTYCYTLLERLKVIVRNKGAQLCVCTELIKYELNLKMAQHQVSTAATACGPDCSFMLNSVSLLKVAPLCSATTSNERMNECGDSIIQKIKTLS